MSHPTPRTDATIGQDLRRHAETLERELAECRIRLARGHEITAYAAERDGRDEEASALRAAAAHLRDLNTPLDVSKL